MLTTESPENTMIRDIFCIYFNIHVYETINYGYIYDFDILRTFNLHSVDLQCDINNTYAEE